MSVILKSLTLVVSFEAKQMVIRSRHSCFAAMSFACIDSNAYCVSNERRIILLLDVRAGDYVINLEIPC